jgi:hypothetical protein
VEARIYKGHSIVERVADFLFKKVVTRYRIFGVLIVNGGAENRSVVERLNERYSTRHIKITPYNARVNGLVEVRHRPIIEALLKLTSGTGRDAKRKLHAVL